MDILEYFSGQGKINIGPRNADGTPGPLRWVGDATLEFGFTPNETKFAENWTGTRGTGLTLTGDTDATLTLTFLQFNDENFKIATRGTTQTQSVTPVVGKTIATDALKVGDILSLGAFDVSAVAIKDSTSGTPITMTEGVTYKLNAKFGSIEILDITTEGPFVGATKADLTPGAVDLIKMMASSGDEYWVRFEGQNTVPGATYKYVVADFYRWSPPPSETMSLLQDGQSRLETPIAGSLLADSTKGASDEFGYYGRMAMLQA